MIHFFQILIFHQGYTSIARWFFFITVMIFHDADEFTSKWLIFNSLRNICHSIDFFLTLINKLFSLNFSFSFSWAWLSLASFYLFLQLTSLQILLILFPIFILLFYHFSKWILIQTSVILATESSVYVRSRSFMLLHGIYWLSLSLYCSFQGQQSLLYD